MDDDPGDVAMLPELLDRSFGSGPDGLPSPAERLAVGRRVRRRRRRLGLAASSAAVVAAIGVGVALSGPGADRGADGPRLPLATSGTTPSTSPEKTAQRQRALERQARKARQREHRLEQQLVSEQFPAAYGADGQVVVKDGWEVTTRVDNPLGLQAPETSVGLAVTNGSSTRWLMLSHEHAVDGDGHELPNAFGDSSSADDPGKGYARFEDWLASQVALEGGPATAPLVVVTAADQVQPGPGAEIEAVQPMPVVDGYSSQGDRMAKVVRDGRTWFVVVRGHGPEAEVIPVDADLLPEPTFDAFLDHVRDQAGSGEGLR